MYLVVLQILQYLRSCFKIIQVSIRQGKNWRESAVYMGVNDHFA